MTASVGSIDEEFTQILPYLLENTQNNAKNQMRTSLSGMVNVCEYEYMQATRSAEENDEEMPIDIPLPVYDFPILFDRMLRQIACNR